MENDQRNIPTPLGEAVQATWRDAVEYTVRHFGDRAHAEEVVDGVVNSSARACRQKPIRESGLLSAFRSDAAGQELAGDGRGTKYVGSPEPLEALNEARDTAWAAKLEEHVLLEDSTFDS